MSSNVEKWLSDNISDYKKQYGPEWERQLYQAAWKKFKLVEHKESSYINKWIDKGFNIKKTELDKGYRFDISKASAKFHINEPVDGTYQLSTSDNTFDTFDAAMEFYIHDQNSDSNIIEQLKRLAGIV